MTFVDLFTSTESIEKTRKSLFAASIALPLFAGVKFLSEELNIFGLTVQISHERLGQIERIAVCFLLLILLLRTIPIFLSWLYGKLELKDTKWEERTRASLPDYKNIPEEHQNGGEDPFDNLEDYEIAFSKSIERRKRIRVYVGDTFQFSGQIVVSFANYFLPVFLGLFAATEPYYLRDILNRTEHREYLDLVDQINWTVHDFRDQKVKLLLPSQP